MRFLEWLQLICKILHGNNGWWWRSHQSLAHKGLRIFRFCVRPWKGEREPTIKYCLGRKVELVQEFMSKLSDPPEFKGRIIFMSMFNDIIWRSEDNEQECIANPALVSISQKKNFQQDIGHSSGLDQKQSGILLTMKDQKGEWDEVAELMMIKFGESGHPVFRATSPLCRGTLKSKGGGKLSVHFCADGDTIETVFRTIISVNQLSIFGADSDLCEEYGSCRTRTGDLLWQNNLIHFSSQQTFWWWRPPSIEVLAQENLLQKHKERVEKLQQPDQLIKICTDAGFLKTVEVGHKEDDNNEQKLLRWISKNLRWKRMYLLLRADQRSKQNHKDVFLPAHPQKLYLLGKELGPILNHKIIRPSIIQCRSNWSFFFVMVIYLEKMVERLNSGDWKIIFGTNLCTLNIGLMKCGRVPWQEAEETRKDFNIVLILQDKKFFTSELFKVIQDAVS